MCVCVLFSFLKSGFHSEDSLCGFVIFYCRAGRVGGGWGRGFRPLYSSGDVCSGFGVLGFPV